jgi:hypothetical protein
MRGLAFFAFLLALPVSAGSITQNSTQNCTWKGTVSCGKASEIATCGGSDIVYADNHLVPTSLTITAPGASDSLVTIKHPRAPLQDYQLALATFGTSIADGSFKPDPADRDQKAWQAAIQDILAVSPQVQAAKLTDSNLKIGLFSFVPDPKNPAIFENCHETQAVSASGDDDEPTSALFKNMGSAPAPAANRQSSDGTGQREVPVDSGGTGESTNGQSRSGS